MHASLRTATLSVASLLTGCRYSELTGMHVDDFNTNASVITIRESKAGKPRHVVLTDEGQRLFASLTDAGGDLYRRNAAKPDLNSTHREPPRCAKADLCANREMAVDDMIVYRYFWQWPDFRAPALEHFPLMLIHSLRVGRNWRILADKRREGANEFCARGPVSSAQPPFAAVL